jgi:hypothetical protein
MLYVVRAISTRYILDIYYKRADAETRLKELREKLNFNYYISQEIA